MAAHRVVLDEGGVRHSLGDAHRYFAFSDIADLELRTRLLRDPVLVLLDREGNEHVVFAGPDALEIHKALAEHALDAAPAREAAHWPRRGQPLEVWLRSLDASDTYRTSGDVSARALAVLGDAGAAIEDRAAAAYLVVRHAEGEELVAAAKLFLTRTLPPLVAAATRLAEGGISLSEDDGWHFISAEDRKSLGLHRVYGTSRHEEAAAEARRQLNIELEDQPMMPVHGGHRGNAKHGPAAYRDMSRWIGKSWGI